MTVTLLDAGGGNPPAEQAGGHVWQHDPQLRRELPGGLGVENALVEIQDYGCLDFAIRARLKTAVRRARRSEHG